MKQKTAIGGIKFAAQLFLCSILLSLSCEQVDAQEQMTGTGYCVYCGTDRPYTKAYQMRTLTEHSVRYWCTVCGSDQAGGVLFTTHEYENNLNSCTDCGIVRFSVTVPTTLPVSVDAYGRVTTATNVSIQNQSTGSITAKVFLKPTSENSLWSLVPFDTDMTALKVNTRCMAFQLEGIDFSNPNAVFEQTIGRGQSLPISYSAKIPALSAAYEDTRQIFTLQYVVNWTEGSDVDNTASLPTSYEFADAPGSYWWNWLLTEVASRHYMAGIRVENGKEVFGITTTQGVPVTRAQSWVLLARACEQLQLTESTNADWYADARAWVMSKGISSGESPNDCISRQQLITMLYQHAGSPDVSGTTGKYPTFEDLIKEKPDAANTDAYARNAILWAVNSDILQGRTNGALAPRDYTTREETAAIVYRYLYHRGIIQ
jgi:hypothetical protein